ncbi:MAG: DUF6326 family protein [Candidatus Thorarchaeota archaeon SMTZ1-45]|nr:MAG: hypothetical protein AM325_04020 [Candidatus Thorarchaeota archaeon SMTZ1-45]
MEDVQLILSGLWISLMLTYLLGDVLRIFAGDFVAGEMEGNKATQGMWMVAAIIMLIPIVMVSMSLILPHPANGWINIIVSIFLFLFNLSGVRTYPSYFDRFLIVVGLVFNVLIVWYAWNWIGAV